METQALVDSGARRAETVRAVRSLAPVDVAFSARLDPTGRSFVLDTFSGARTARLRNIASPIREGLGGQCIAARRPVVVRDYFAARGITHRYDQQVADEGLCSVFAIPIMSSGAVSGLVYGASREANALSDRVIADAVSIVMRAASSTIPIENRDERPAPTGRYAVADIARDLEQLTTSVADPQLKRRLVVLSERLAGLNVSADIDGVRLSPRELEVLTVVAFGCGNDEVAQRLGLTVLTVKSYLKAVMFKLGCHTRGEAVYRARAAGLLP